MANASYQFEQFYTRDGFNSSLGHFQSVSEIIRDVSQKLNLADILFEEIEEGSLQQNQLSPIIFALLVDKYGYSYGTVNLKENVEDFSALHKEVIKWNGVDLVGTYIHPELGFLVFNPKNIGHLASLQIIKKNEIVNIYAGSVNSSVDTKTAEDAVDCFLSLLSGKNKKTPAALLKGSFNYKQKSKPVEKKKTVIKKTKASAKKTSGTSTVKTLETAKSQEATTTPQAGPRKMTPLYSVPVTNELFHNGNVEAWKRVIKSYTTKHPQLEVYIFYEGERIHDINALFKWGKVKHGSSILFAVAGENVKDVAKLQRYLMQGASPRFEDFLRFPVNTVLNLF